MTAPSVPRARRSYAAEPMALAGSYAAGALGGRAMRNFAPAAYSANVDAAGELLTLRARARHLVRNEPIAGGAIATTVSRAVGRGLSLQYNPALNVLGLTPAQGAALKEAVEAEFALWAERAEAFDLAATLDFYDAQDLVLRTTLASGDAFTLLPYEARPGHPYGLKVQVLEADRVGNPTGEFDSETLVDGIRIDPATSRPTAAFVYARHPGGMLGSATARAGQWYAYHAPRGARVVLHHYRMLRPEQTRGVPHLAPIMAKLHQLNQYSDAELTAALVTSFLTLAITTETPEASPLLPTEATANTEPDEVRMGPAAVLELAPGQDASMLNPTRPNPAFDPFFNAIVRQIGVGLEIPFEVLMKHFDASYSASRAALLDAWSFFRGRREWVAKSFCQPVFEAWFEEAAALGRVAAPGFFADPARRAAYLRAAWTGDAMGALNPRDEVRAWNEAVAGGIATRERAEMELFGSDYNRTLPQKVREAADQRRLQPAPPPAPANPPPGLENTPPGPSNAPADDSADQDDETEDEDADR